MDTSTTAAPRFYCDGPLAAGAEISLPDRAARHVAVLRLRAGDAVTVFNGAGGEFRCTLSRVSRDGATVRVASRRDVERESSLEVTLAQGLSGGDRMDFAVQKATELGVRAIVPMASERSVVRLTGERADRRLSHWRAIAAAACEQCGRNRLPEIRAVSTLGELLSAADKDAVRLMLSPTGAARLRELAPAKKYVLLAGPEGGLTEEEEQRAARSGFLAVRLGTRVLRTETAPLAAIASLQALWGDF